MALNPSRQILDTLLKSERPLILFRKDWNADSVASALALQKFLARRGKKAEIIADGFSKPKSLVFLAGVEDIKSSLSEPREFVIALDVAKTKIGELRYDIRGDKLHISITPKEGAFEPKDVSAISTDFKYDCIVTVDTPDYGELGAPFAQHASFFYSRPTVNIDHDPANEQYGNVNSVDITASSTCEVLYNLFKSDGGHFLDADIASCLLTGIIAKTRSFKTSTVTPRALEIASELVAAGGKRDAIVQNLYRTRSIATLKLWGRALARLKYDPEIKMAWTVLVRQDFVHAGASEEHLQDINEELIVNAPDAEISGLLYEQESPTEPGKVAQICGLVYSEKHADVQGLVAGLKPEGSQKLARLYFKDQGIVDSEKQMLAVIRKSLGK